MEAAERPKAESQAGDGAPRDQNAKREQSYY